MKTVYSTEPEKWGRTVRDFHRDIKGTVSDGSRYHALNPELFYWAHATFVDQVLYITDTFIRRLSYAEKVQISRRARSGISSTASATGTAGDLEEFLEYWDDMLNRFVPHKTVVYATGYIRQGLPRPKKIPRPCGRSSRRR